MATQRSIEAMQAQLRAFDEQLIVMEKILDPLTKWSTVWVWADLEQMGRPLASGPETDADPDRGSGNRGAHRGFTLAR